MFLLIDKPKAMTSHDVVDRVRGVTGERKVGHAGTLDPNATGLLILGIGKQATRKLGEISKNTTKTYEAEIYLGEERDTDDSEGRLICKTKDFSIPTKKEVVQVINSFLGSQKQRPPSFSAIKLGGKKAYQLARKGQKPKLKPRKITVYSIKVLDYQWPILTLCLTVSSGTYIRAIARDFGRKLGCGAYLKNLRRTAIGRYSLDRAISLANLNSENWESFARMKI